MKRSLITGAWFISVAIGLMNGQALETQQDLAKYVNKLMDLEVAVEQAMPPGVRLDFKETSRKGSGKDLVVMYRAYVKGVPTGTLFDKYRIPVGQETPVGELGGISVGKDGLLICAGKSPGQCGDPKTPDDPIDFIFQPIKGEPYRILLAAPNVQIGTVLVPVPIAATDKGCTLSAVRLTADFGLAFISGSGYPPNTDIHYRFSSERTSDRVIKSDENGVIRASEIPYPGTKSKGIATVKVTEAKCAPEISFEWGTTQE